MERAAEFMTPEYIQHNPNVESGRDAFVNTIGKARPPRPVQATSRFPIINIIAERDMVMVMWARKVRDREHPEQIYEMTWFDVFRVDEKTRKIAEHWDCSERWGSSGRPPGAEFFPPGSALTATAVQPRRCRQVVALTEVPSICVPRATPAVPSHYISYMCVSRVPCLA